MKRTFSLIALTSPLGLKRELPKTSVPTLRLQIYARSVGSGCRFPTRMQKLAFQASSVEARNKVYVAHWHIFAVASKAAIGIKPDI